MNRQIILRGTILVFAVVFLAILDIVFGSVSIPIRHIFDYFFSSIPEENSLILREIRFPKMITAILAGAALSVSGLLMQTMFRNPLAGPDVMGISSGAGLGVAILLMSTSFIFPNIEIWGSNWAMIFAAWIGASAVLMLLFAVTLRVRDNMTLLILGILFGTGIGALINMMQYFGEAQNLKAYVIWTMGSVSGVSVSRLQVLIPVVLTGLFLAFFSAKQLNVLLLGENFAKTVGLNMRTTRLLIFLSTGILTGSITAFCGPIGFVGVIVPHLATAFFKTADRKILIPSSALFGAAFLLAGDIITQISFKSGSLPLNSVTAFFGIPVLIWIILKAKI